MTGSSSIRRIYSKFAISTLMCPCKKPPLLKKEKMILKTVISDLILQAISICKEQGYSEVSIRMRRYVLCAIEKAHRDRNICYVDNDVIRQYIDNQQALYQSKSISKSFMQFQIKTTLQLVELSETGIVDPESMMFFDTKSSSKPMLQAFCHNKGLSRESPVG